MKIGLVLSGGGGKGAYELGVWKALKELQVDKCIDVFSGTSIGAFNAVLFAQDDIEAAEELWNEVTMEKLVPISKFELLKKGIGLILGAKNINYAKKYINEKLNEGAATKEGAIEIIDKYLKFDIMKEKEKVCYAATTELPDFNVKYFKLNDYDNDICKQIITASASLPLIYESTEVLGGKYIDGGMADNTPITPVYEEGCELIIVVLLNKALRIDRSLYPNAHIVELVPRNLDENVIKGTLNLEAESKRNRINEGYRDTIEILGPIIKLAEIKIKKEELEKYKWLYRFYNWIKKKIFNE